MAPRGQILPATLRTVPGSATRWLTSRELEVLGMLAAAGQTTLSPGELGLIP